ncbi:VC0807 family protein [Hahella sp. CCB-MM4]|uniref:VC0807 family protein n=1 Tax=Hahella sp. (strain CCB-MM4) TaxID=1926491 RepID=UPI001AEFBACC|nr:VC0807 family protein [Hahella sp. CCB-MM4]
MTAEQKTIESKTNTNQQKGGLLFNLLFNIVIPTVILSKFSSDEYLGPMYSIVAALSFPIAYGIRDFMTSHKPNFFSIFGVVNVILTGGMSLMQLDPQYIAIKEAAVPAMFGIATMISLKTRYPLVRTFLFNEQVMQVQKVNEALEANGNHKAFEQKLVNASYMVAASFFLSSVLNYILAKVVLVSQPGTTAFTEELGKMTALSFPVIAVPSTLVLMGALWYLISQIQKLSHLKLEDIFDHM